jgi:hypothetical protein
MGHYAGFNNQGNNSTAVGYYAGETTQQRQATAIGYNAGSNTQQDNAVAVGAYSGFSNQQTGAVALGAYSGLNNQGDFSVALGYEAGAQNQGDYSIAIGYQAGSNAQQSNTIVLNASTSNWTTSGPNSTYIYPIANFVGSHNLTYDVSTKQLAYTSLGANLTYVRLTRTTQSGAFNPNDVLPWEQVTDSKGMTFNLAGGTIDLVTNRYYEVTINLRQGAVVSGGGTWEIRMNGTGYGRVRTESMTSGTNNGSLSSCSTIVSTVGVVNPIVGVYFVSGVSEVADDSHIVVKSLGGY